MKEIYGQKYLYTLIIFGMVFVILTFLGVFMTKKKPKISLSEDGSKCGDISTSDLISAMKSFGIKRSDDALGGIAMGTYLLTFIDENTVRKIVDSVLDVHEGKIDKNKFAKATMPHVTSFVNDLVDLFKNSDVSENLKKDNDVKEYFQLFKEDEIRSTKSSRHDIDSLKSMVLKLAKQYKSYDGLKIVQQADESKDLDTVTVAEWVFSSFYQVIRKHGLEEKKKLKTE